jgi:hypothetical protein
MGVALFMLARWCNFAHRGSDIAFVCGTFDHCLQLVLFHLFVARCVCRGSGGL